MRIISFLLIWVGVIVSFSSCVDSVEDPFSKQLNNDVAIIDDYLVTNGITTAIKDVSGVRYNIQSLGTGIPPRMIDQVSFDYTGKLINGTVFETSSLSEVEIASLVAGFQIALPQIPEESTATLYIPSGYGYGSTAHTNIPANSILIFEITLKKIKVISTEVAQLKTDTTMIDQYLAAESIDAVKDPTGLRYVITQLGTGETPGWFSRVKISYTGYLLNSGTPPTKGSKFYEGTNEPSAVSDSRVVNYIRGFQLGLIKMPKGTKATLFVPSGMGFGNQSISGGTVLIPANSNLIYNIELIDVLPPNP
jgi:FKBP-type peptidyl-prolyl cis-trans isomerase FkpA